MKIGKLVPMVDRYCTYCTSSTGYWYRSAVHDEHGRSKTSDKSFHNPYTTVGQIVLSWMEKKVNSMTLSSVTAVATGLSAVEGGGMMVNIFHVSCT